ncbi:MAG TPA: hypothetical protein EYP68_06320 [Candidatus Korarchaeota archaeon]|nr:hypothetical protein [Candidatus Korarchaeota archaeon]
MSFEFKTIKEAEKALEKVEEDLIMGKISEEEYKNQKRRIKACISLLELEDLLIEGKITEDEYKQKKKEYEAIISGEIVEKEVAPLAKEVKEIVSKIKEVKKKREKLRDLLVNKEISEKTFNKLDLEYEEKEKNLTNELSEKKEELESRISEIEKELEKVRLQLEELRARLALEEISGSEYDAKKSTLEKKEKSLSSEMISLKEALELLE